MWENRESTKRGWRLFSVISSVIPPSKNLENYLKHFVNQQFNHKDPDIETMARFSMKMIEKLCKTGPKGRTLSVPEIERAWVREFFGTLTLFSHGTQ